MYIYKRHNPFPNYLQKKINQHLIDLLAYSHLLKEKTRISLYLPKALIQVMDTMAGNQSRSEFIKNAIVNQAKINSQPKQKSKYKLSSSRPHPLLKLKGIAKTKTGKTAQNHDHIYLMD